jgi:hypothetical protein
MISSATIASTITSVRQCTHDQSALSVIDHDVVFVGRDDFGTSLDRVAPPADFQSLSSLRTHASFGLHLCNILQAGHASRKDMFGRDANLIVSVRSPVGTGVPKTGQRITISDITFGPSGC